MKDLFHNVFVEKKKESIKFITATTLIIFVIIAVIALIVQAWIGNFTIWNWLSKTFIWTIIMSFLAHLVVFALLLYDEIS